WNKLVSGYTVRHGQVAERWPGGPLEYTGIARTGQHRGAPALLGRFLTIATLAAAAPAGTRAAAMRDKITALHVSGSRETNWYATAKPGTIAPVDLAPLAALPELRELEVTDVEDL